MFEIKLCENEIYGSKPKLVQYNLQRSSKVIYNLMHSEVEMEILEPGTETLSQELDFSLAHFIESLSQKVVWIIQPFREFAFSFVF